MARVLGEEQERRPVPNEPTEPSPPYDPPGPTSNGHPGRTSATRQRARPYSASAEESALGAMLLTSLAVDTILPILRVEDFYVVRNANVYAAIASVAARSVPVDPVTIAEEMGNMGTLPDEGPAFLLSLQAKCPATSNAGSYAAIIADKARLRRLQDALAEGVDAVNEGDATKAWAIARGLEEVARDPKLRTWTSAQLVDADRTFRWLIRSLLVSGTYGTLAGERKTLKTYVAMAIALAVAAGQPLFDVFPVDEAAPVLFYVGEGGRAPFTRRLERVAQAMKISLRDLPLISSFDIAPIESDAFQSSLRAHLKEHQPALVHLDPLYAFHGSKANGTNLHEEGALLSSVSAPCVDHGSALLITNHFSKTGTGRGLDRITLSGSQEWSDTWLLLSHREPPRVQAGSFRLLLEVGSRQWGGSEWDLDLELGRFDADSGEYDGAISWAIDRHDDSEQDDEHLERMLDAVTAQPGELSKEQIAKSAGVNMRRARQLVDKLEHNRLIEPRLLEVPDARGHRRKAWRYFPVSEEQTPFQEAF